MPLTFFYVRLQPLVMILAFQETPQNSLFYYILVFVFSSQVHPLVAPKRRAVPEASW